ncbi:MAG: phosphoribosylanthranilate isomerase [Proteobacteria bacterium]|nr:phosphoribosylanthranilate isomerase [Pseudomonadota bacterium]
MSVAVKICGLNAPEAVAAAVEGGASLTGFVFFAASPRNVSPATAARLMAAVPDGILKVGLVVDADDRALEAIVRQAPLDLLQLHGDESVERVAEIKERFERPVMKVVAISGPRDIDRAHAYEAVADRLLFDARAPAGATRPGGNALAFDWRLVAGETWRVPWLLAGGLTAETLSEAVRVSGALAVDVSSGVEDAPGRKNPDKIRAFLAAARRL